VNIEALEDDVKSFKAAPDALGLKTLFKTLLTLAGEKQSQALAQLKANFGKPNLSDKAKQALDYSEHFCKLYPNDNGLFAPLFLNIVELQPGEAMFLHAETPHAYVQGTALEVMASSDNVLRAGLTPKHIDVEELVSNVRFEPILESELLTKPLVREGHLHFPVPVDDFRFDVLEAKQTKQSVYVRSAEIVFCVEGEVHLASADKKITLKAGESALIPFDTTQYQYSGTGLLARVSN
jgi:mannose-6-phosphate isomerase